MKTAWLIVPLLIAAGPALAEDIPVKREKPPKVKKVCRADTLTGSRIARPICATEAEWKVHDEEQAAKARDVIKLVSDQERLQVPQGAMQNGPNGFNTVNVPPGN